MNATVLKVLPTQAISWEDQALQSAARERGLSRLLMAYISTGLAFLVLPGTLIGVWNLISISSAHFEGAARVGWVQTHDAHFECQAKSLHIRDMFPGGGSCCLLRP